uniref:Uncharacterized protein n=1 Tax=Compsopogon caeruleus TaxID=31354 RepID=A0A7S1TAH5_9RHOD|mmetsp:Transcript_14471/g.29586  ORF Transcript_14471/g.29586 Transcript_14471/m.29586 type:complete len:245 (+) Transcript_14471:77-811(+)
MAFWLVGVVAAASQLSAMIMRRRRDGRREREMKRREEFRKAIKDGRGPSRFCDVDYCLSLAMDLGMPALMLRKRCEVMNRIRNFPDHGNDQTKWSKLQRVTMDSANDDAARVVALDPEYCEESDCGLQLILRGGFGWEKLAGIDFGRHLPSPSRPKQLRSGRNFEEDTLELGMQVYSGSSQVNEKGCKENEWKRRQKFLDSSCNKSLRPLLSEQVLSENCALTTLDHLYLTCDRLCTSLVRAAQ